MCVCVCSDCPKLKNVNKMLFNGFINKKRNEFFNLYSFLMFVLSNSEVFGLRSPHLIVTIISTTNIHVVFAGQPQAEATTELFGDPKLLDRMDHWDNGICCTLTTSTPPPETDATHASCINGGDLGQSYQKFFYSHGERNKRPVHLLCSANSDLVRGCDQCRGQESRGVC